jgi:primosomal protein N' (replication factor Y) (superfamily II helicase)
VLALHAVNHLPSLRVTQELEMKFCQVALDTPLRRLFDYLLPTADAALAVQPGMRVRVPFGRQQLVGVVVALSNQTDIVANKLRSVIDVLDAQPLFNAGDLALLDWAANYYHHPIGQVFAAALPRLLREGHDGLRREQVWRLTAAGRAALVNPALRRAPKQRLVLETLAGSTETSSVALDKVLTDWRSAARSLLEKAWIESEHRDAYAANNVADVSVLGLEPVLTNAQATAVQQLLTASTGGYLLDGVTGSGKTEVYLRTIAAVLGRGASVLVLCPEIGLTPQLLQRFEQRFDAPIAALHSGLTDTERARAWVSAARGQARIVIGTRSAVFTPIPRLGLIVIDEEHDASYKQQEGGFRYSARDLALLRGAQEKVPVILGSATPSLESLQNVVTQRLTHICLPERAGSAQPPRLVLVDMRAHAVHKGIAMPLLQTMQRHLEAGAQVLLYLNRRGYAPSLVCQSCSWSAPCRSCDARLTVHQRSDRLACHHCGAEEVRPERCPRCGYEVHALGHGTERVEETLAERFPQYPIERFDRDSLRQQQELEAAIDRVNSGAARILVGTQMLTKGHHFPDVSLVGVLNADQSLFSTDFRAAERLAQTIVQVAGRAGRAERAGEVMIQSHYPDHPLLTQLLQEGYAGFAKSCLVERADAHWPPFARLAVLRASATTAAGVMNFLQAAAALPNDDPCVVLRSPMPSTMHRRADRYHAQMVIESLDRMRLQKFLGRWVQEVEGLGMSHGLRWALDVDPLEIF